MNREQLTKLENNLWAAADKLRANSDLKASEYSTPVLGLIFLKFADNKYRQHEAAILQEFDQLKGTRREKPLEEIAMAKCGFFLEDHARYDYLLQLPEKEDIAKAVRRAMASIEKSKPELRGVLPQEEYDRFSAYNAGATATENYYDELTAFADSLKEEAERHIREGLTEDELELFDLLKKDALSQDETQKVKLAAKHLLKRLVEEQPKVLIQSWHHSVQTQRQVRAEIERVLDAELPDSYDRTTFKQKCDNVYDLAVEYAVRQRKWAA